MTSSVLFWFLVRAAHFIGNTFVSLTEFEPVCLSVWVIIFLYSVIIHFIYSPLYFVQVLSVLSFATSVATVLLLSVFPIHLSLSPVPAPPPHIIYGLPSSLVSKLFPIVTSLSLSVFLFKPQCFSFWFLVRLIQLCACTCPIFPTLGSSLLCLFCAVSVSGFLDFVFWPLLAWTFPLYFLFGLFFPVPWSLPGLELCSIGLLILYFCLSDRLPGFLDSCSTPACQLIKYVPLLPWACAWVLRSCSWQPHQNWVSFLLLHYLVRRRGPPRTQLLSEHVQATRFYFAGTAQLCVPGLICSSLRRGTSREC